MKTILLKPRFRGMPLHSLYNELAKNPPDNYKFLTLDDSQKNLLTNIAGKHHGYFYKQLLYNLGGLPYLLKQLNESVDDHENYDLIYAAQHILSTQKPWITDLEFVNALSGYCSLDLSKNIIAKKLKSKGCKAILPASEWAKDTLLNSIDCREFKDKITVVRYTVSPKNLEKVEKDKDVIRMLFLGSMNQGNIASFEFKGLYEIVEAFIQLQAKYDGLELVIRSLVPHEVRERIKDYSNIKILGNFLTEQELSRLYTSSDIFPHTGFEVLNLSILEAMSYGIPVIATSIYNTPEAIQNKKNGMLIDLPKKELFYTKYGTPNDHSKIFLDSMRKLRPFMIEEIKECMKLLVDDSSLRNRIGKEAKMTIESGEFSIKKRNDKLKDIFDYATS